MLRAAVILARNHRPSGVTRVGVTRGGKLMVSPKVLFPEKLATFLVITVFTCRLPTFDVDSTQFFINSATKLFSFGCHPLDGVTRCGPPPPLVTPQIDR